MCFVCPAVYHALYLEELTLLDLSEKIALLYSITPQQITHIYRQKSNGIHVLVSDEVSLHLWYQPLIFNTSELSKQALFEGTGVVSSADQDLYLTQGFMTDQISSMRSCVKGSRDWYSGKSDRHLPDCPLPQLFRHSCGMSEKVQDQNVNVAACVSTESTSEAWKKRLSN